MKVGVIGAAGRMGSTACRTLEQAGDTELVAAVDPAAAGRPATEAGRVVIAPGLEALTEARAEVAVDFTTPAVAVDNALWCATHGVNVVIGTSGISDEALQKLGQAFPAGGRLGCAVVPNFAIGAVLMMRFAELAAPWFETAEIIELHHDAKVDAPSGTAIQTADLMAAASSEWGPDPTKVETVPGARGALGPANIRIHSVRLKGLVAHQEVLFGGVGQSLTIRHDSYDRESFMPGVLQAVHRIPTTPGLTVGLDRLLGI